MDNIGIFVKTLSSGGAEKQATLLAKVLTSNHTVHMILWSDVNCEDKYTKILEQSNVKIHRLKGSFYEKFSKLRHLLSTANISILFSYLTFANAVGALSALRLRTKVVPGLRSSKLSFPKLLSDMAVCNFLTPVTVANSYCGKREFVRRGFSESHIEVIPNMLDSIPTFKPRQVSADGNVNVISVGRFVDAKDYPTAIRAVAEARKSVPNLRYKIVGYGELEQNIRTWVKEYGIDDITDIFINPPHIDKLLSQSDIFLMSSVFEGTSNALLEAIGYGVPTIVTDVGDNAYIISSSNDGMVFMPGDYMGMADGIIKYASEPELRNSTAENAYKCLKSNFSESVFKDAYEKLILRLSE